MLDKEDQGQGIGTEIIHELEEGLKKSGFTEINLAFIQGNRQSEHFWLKNGFEKIEKQKTPEMQPVLLRKRLL